MNTKKISGILPDFEILRLADEGMIQPFQGRSVGKGVVSNGLSSFGYDMRPDNRWLVFKPSQDHNLVVDPKNFREELVQNVVVDRLILHPGYYALVASVETFNLPPDVFGLVVGKSTYARCGILVNVTPLEPGWAGRLTIEIANLSPAPVAVYAFEGIAQVIFFRGHGPELNYTTKSDGGKYQDQAEVTTPKIC